MVGSRSSATKLVLLRPKAPAVTHEALCIYNICICNMNFHFYSISMCMFYIFAMLLLRLRTFDIVILKTLNTELQVTCFDHTLDFQGTSLGSRPPSCKKSHKFEMRARCCRSHCATDFNVLHQLQLLNHEVC